MENLLAAWEEFVLGKRKKSDVQYFSLNLYDNILAIHIELANKIYKHGSYHNFNISDPKPRSISKASVKDRLIHHAVYRKLYPFFDRQFIFDSYSCRNGKGSHRALRRLHNMFLEASDGGRRTCFVLKLDIKKFFASIDHGILLEVLRSYIPDQDIIWLLSEIIGSFEPGLPLGNLTSQLFVNIYMARFDKFVKNDLKVMHFIRYADDFIVLYQRRNELLNLLTVMRQFLENELKLELHPNKIILKTFASGIDFLGWVNFPNHRILRTVAKRRMLGKINVRNQHSYFGLLKHGNTLKLKQKMLNQIYLEAGIP